MIRKGGFAMALPRPQMKLRLNIRTGIRQRLFVAVGAIASFALVSAAAGWFAVSRLDNAIVRMIEVELSGRHVEASQEDVLRSVGRPDKEGRCKLSSGMLVASY